MCTLDIQEIKERSYIIIYINSFSRFKKFFFPTEFCFRSDHEQRKIQLDFQRLSKKALMVPLVLSIRFEALFLRFC